jgi:hypothetical protein
VVSAALGVVGASPPPLPTPARRNPGGVDGLWGGRFLGECRTCAAARQNCTTSSATPRREL